MGQEMLSKKLPHPLGEDLGPHLTHGSLGPSESIPIWHLNRFSHFCGAHGCDQQRHTDHGIGRNVCCAQRCRRLTRQESRPKCPACHASSVCTRTVWDGSQERAATAKCQTSLSPARVACTPGSTYNITELVNTHTHTTRSTALFPGLPGWADFTKARDSEWQWHQLGHMQVCTSIQTDNHASTPPLSFLQAGCPSCCPTKSIKALKAQN